MHACTCSLLPSFCMITEMKLKVLYVIAHFVAELAVLATWMLIKVLRMI